MQIEIRFEYTFLVRLCKISFATAARVFRAEASWRLRQPGSAPNLFPDIGLVLL